MDNESEGQYPWLFCSKQKIGCEYCKEIGKLKTVKKRGVEISEEWTKYNRPFDDHFKLIELQKANGISLGSILHSRSATTIIDHIATKMREQLVKNIIDCSAKFSVLVDESTTLNSKTSMVVYIKSAISNDDPIFMFLDLVELDNQLAVNIDIFWHCMNHRLELAVNDSVKDVTATNHYKAFLDSLYALYNRSPKNQNELKTICTELDMIFLKVGRVLDVRWVASSYRAVQAIWKIFPALYNHLYNASNDPTKDKKTQSKYTGLYKKLGSPQFVLDLALMCDILKELSYLSNQLQSHAVTLLQSDQLIKRTIRVLESFKTKDGEHVLEAKEAQIIMLFKTIGLTNNQKLICINPSQFITSMLI
ncbi:E3 SUMO-protein ligase KIAA1586-like [Acyrthosiphon pisum]|uniref:DUF4371 domain-containing protein n=1 Tax=Acyrthosiphon pisum TaxID=7029 RepID=A0A8R2JMA6_ACYPI|nr:E3 SUMO-protein ligase KIAA1586-like [Acyrthosiphon pisum]